VPRPTTLDEDTNAVDYAEDDDDIEKLQAEIKRMEEEAARISAMEEAEKNGGSNATTEKSGSSGPSASGGATSAAAESPSSDKRSIYIGQVDYGTTPEELVAHFSSCGVVERVTIACDKFSGRPKGYAYLEFQDDSSIENALKLDGSKFRERDLKVKTKRKNEPAAVRGGGGRFGGRFGGRGGPGIGGRFGRGGRGRGYRGGGRGGYHPYY